MINAEHRVTENWQAACMKPILASLLAAAVVTAGCGSDTTNSADTGTTPGVTPADSAAPPTDAPATTPPATDAPDTTAPPATEPTSTDAPATTAAPATEPPATEPPATEAPPATEPPATPAPTAPPTTAAPAPTDGLAVVYGGGGGAFPWAPLAWWDGAAGEWNQAGYAADGSFVLPPSSTFATASATSLDLPDGPGQVVGDLLFGADDFYCVGDETGPVTTPEVVVPDTPVSLGFDALMVTADWPIQPRPVQQIGADNPEYATIGASFIDAPTADLGTVSQAVRVDLDGDGVEEVLVTYEYITDSQFGAENDFSTVYVRFPNADGTVVDQELENYVVDDPTDFPTVGRFTIAAVGDMNGDGVMEIATRSSFWESAGITLWTLDEGRFVIVGGGGCGV